VKTDCGVVSFEWNGSRTIEVQVDGERVDAFMISEPAVGLPSPAQIDTAVTNHLRGGLDSVISLLVRQAASDARSAHHSSEGGRKVRILSALTEAVERAPA